MKTTTKNYQFYWEKPSNENAKELEVRIDVPGFRKDEISADISRTAIKISAVKKRNNVEKGLGFFRRESFENSFSRMIALPNGVNAKNFMIEISDGFVVVRRKNR